MKPDTDALSSPVILLVDNAPTAELYAEAFRQSYRVFTTSNLNDAEKILTDENPELVVVEPSIGGDLGWEWVKGMIETYAIPTIICSALDDRKMGLDAGVSAYLIKPVAPSTLSQTVSNFLNKP